MGRFGSKLVSMAVVLGVGVVAAPDAQAACADGKTYKIALTFDDGPNPILTPRVLDTLKKHAAPSTFFVLGDQFATEERRRALFPIMRRMIAEGHIVGSHSWSHVPHTRQSEAGSRELINKSKTVIGEFLSPIFRLPYGDGSFPASDPGKRAANERVMRQIREAGYVHVGWRIDTNDWDPRKRDTLLPKLQQDICSMKGGVVLFHDVQKNTVDNLDAWITAIKAEGHEIVGLEHFVPEAGMKPGERVAVAPQPGDVASAVVAGDCLELASGSGDDGLSDIVYVVNELAHAGCNHAPGEHT